MKHCLHSVVAASAFAALSSLPVAAQDPAATPKNVIGLSSIGLINKFKLKYERVLTPKFTAAATLAAYYGAYSGVQLVPFGRYYSGAETPSGLYLQGQVGIYCHLSDFEYEVSTSSGTETYTGKATLSNVGAGAGIGYQWLSGKRKTISVDVMAGLRIYKTGLDNEGDVTSLTWYTTGPGSFFNGLLSVGYAFLLLINHFYASQY